MGPLPGFHEYAPLVSGDHLGSPWAVPAFRRVFTATAVSSAGSFMQLVAATWYVYQLTGSAASVGVLAALALGPAVVGAPVGGALVDRFDPRRLATVLCLLQAVPSAAMAALDLTGGLSVGWLYALVFAGAIPMSLNQPVVTLVVLYTAPVECRHSALARSSMMLNVTRLLGAVAGGFTVQRFGGGAAFAVNACSYLVVAAVVAGTPLVSDVARAPRPVHSVGLRTSINDARQIIGDGVRRPTQVAAVGVALFFTFIAPVEQLMPTVVAKHGMTASALGLLIGAIGVGAIVANPIIGRANNVELRRRRLMATGIFCAAAGIIGLALAPYHGLSTELLAMALIGFGGEFVFVGGQSTVAVDVPDNVRGRAMGLFLVLVTATTALGAVALGESINYLGVTWTFLASGGVVVLAGVLLVRLGRSPATTPL